MLILLTGNYTFFNLLTIALCLFLFDDAFSRAAGSWHAKAPGCLSGPNRYVTAAYLVIDRLSCHSRNSGPCSTRLPRTNRARGAADVAIRHREPVRLFAVMTTQRPEIQVEGSQDGQNWEPYLFRYKPGPLNRAAPWVEPYQPRLDWQMWFAALSDPRKPVVSPHDVGLLRGSKPVDALFEQTPFSGATAEIRPRHDVRIPLHTFAERRQTGNWWKREMKGLYFPPVSLRAGQ